MMYDAATGLYYASARWYNPAIGQFTSPDPTGFAAGDANLYRYVGDNPATMSRSWGLSGGGGGDGTWDPGNVSPLMPMTAPDTPFDGPMVTEMGVSVPSPLMPMIAPDTPFEGPMVNEIGAAPIPHYTGELHYSETDGPPTGFVNMLDAGAVPHYTGDLLWDLDGPPTSFVRMLDASIPYGEETIPLLAPGGRLYFARRLDVDHKRRRARLPLRFLYVYCRSRRGAQDPAGGPPRRRSKPGGRRTICC